MGGRGASSASARGPAGRGPLVDSGMIDIEVDYNRRRGGYMEHVLEATSDEEGNVTLDYAYTDEFSRRSGNISVATFHLDHGIYTVGRKETRSHGLDLSRARSVSGRTWDVQGYLEANGFVWDRASRRYVRRQGAR